MTGRTHLLFGLAIALSVKGASQDPLFLSFAAASSLLPDVDSTATKMGKRFPKLSRALNLIFGHRNLTHCLDFALSLSLASALILGLWHGLALSMGYLSHLFLDSLTKGGIKLSVLSGRRVGLRLFRTGGLADHLTAALSLALIGALGAEEVRRALGRL